MTMSCRSITIALLAGLCLTSDGLLAQEVTKENVPGVRNFARLQTTVACAGATSPEALSAIKEMGFVSVINLQSSDGAWR